MTNNIRTVYQGRLFSVELDHIRLPDDYPAELLEHLGPRLGELGALFDNSSGGLPDLPAAFRVLGVTVTAN